MRPLVKALPTGRLCGISASTLVIVVLKSGDRFTGDQ